MLMKCLGTAQVSTRFSPTGPAGKPAPLSSKDFFARLGDLDVLADADCPAASVAARAAEVLADAGVSAASAFAPEAETG